MYRLYQRHFESLPQGLANVWHTITVIYHLNCREKTSYLFFRVRFKSFFSHVAFFHLPKHVALPPKHIVSVLEHLSLCVHLFYSPYWIISLQARIMYFSSLYTLKHIASCPAHNRYSIKTFKLDGTTYKGLLNCFTIFDFCCGEH